jgi:hypothetical protein
MNGDPKIAFEALRKETASMLGFKDTDEPSLVQNLQTDCVTMLRFAIDGLQAEVFGGKDVYLNRLASSLAMLKQLLPVRSLEPPPQLDELQPGEAEEVERTWQQKIASLTAAREQEIAENPTAARQRLEDEIHDALLKYPQPEEKPPWGSAPPPPTEAATTNEQTTEQTTPPQQPPPTRPETDAEWHAMVNSKKPPAHYLRSAADEEIARRGAYFL